MAWPKKNTHRLTIDDDVYLWRINDWATSAWFVVRHAEYENGQILFGSPRLQSAEPGSGMVRKAIDFGLLNGWTPSQSGPPFYATTNGVAYLVDRRRKKECWSEWREDNWFPATRSGNIVMHLFFNEKGVAIDSRNHDLWEWPDRNRDIPDPKAVRAARAEARAAQNIRRIEVREFGFGGKIVNEWARDYDEQGSPIDEHI